MAVICSAEQVAAEIASGTALAAIGFTMIGVPEAVLRAVEARFLATGKPRDITYLHVAGQSDGEHGIEHLAHEGLVRRVIGSHWGLAPRMSRLVGGGAIEAYALPQGQLVQLLRAMGGGRPGVISRVGLGTFVDPRLEGGRMNTRTPAEPPLVELLTLDGEEYLRYRPVPFDYLLLRGTTADEAGNVSAQEEALKLELLPAALAARRFGATVAVQVKRLAARHALHPKQVVLPGFLVDRIVVADDPDETHRQTAGRAYDPSLSGDLRSPTGLLGPLPASVRKVIGRRALREIPDGAVVNLGTGIPGDVIGPVAAEAGRSGAFLLTIESGAIGGVPLGRYDFGVAVNPEAMIDHADMFEYYNGAGVDVTLMGLAEADGAGNVNVSRFAGRAAGCGGFIDITQSAHKVVFCCTLTAGEQEVRVEDGGLSILRDGPVPKFVQRVGQVTFSGDYARRRGQAVVWVTERAVFELRPEGLTLVEVAPGVDVERDVIGRMGVVPRIVGPIGTMPAELFAP